MLRQVDPQVRQRSLFSKTLFALTMFQPLECLQAVIQQPDLATIKSGAPAQTGCAKVIQLSPEDEVSSLCCSRLCGIFHICRFLSDPTFVCFSNE